MNYLDAVGQAHLDAAEGQRALSHALARWIGRTAKHVAAVIVRHLPERAMPW